MDRRGVCALMVLWAMAHLGSPADGSRSLRRTTGGRKGSPGLTGHDANGVPLRRSKRGWMWNQFFLLEEYTGTDMQYVGKVGARAGGFEPQLVFDRVQSDTYRAARQQRWVNEYQPTASL